jgi:hypothetical protein
VDIKFYSPDVHVVLEEVNLDLVFELTGCKEPSIILLYSLGSNC